MEPYRGYGNGGVEMDIKENGIAVNELIRHVG